MYPRLLPNLWASGFSLLSAGIGGHYMLDGNRCPWDALRAETLQPSCFSMRPSGQQCCVWTETTPLTYHLACRPPGGWWCSYVYQSSSSSPSLTPDQKGPFLWHHLGTWIINRLVSPSSQDVPLSHDDQHDNFQGSYLEHHGVEF